MRHDEKREIAREGQLNAMMAAAYFNQLESDFKAVRIPEETRKQIAQELQFSIMTLKDQAERLRKLKDAGGELTWRLDSVSQDLHRKADDLESTRAAIMRDQSNRMTFDQFQKYFDKLTAEIRSVGEQ